MATVVICEPHPDIRALLAFVVRRLGHDAQEADGSVAQIARADALLVEPGDAVGLDVAVRARAELPELPIVCASIFPRGAECAEVRPDAYLVKPFALFELEDALRGALAASVSREPVAKAV